ncbi:MAG: MBL fold metallo-hydrolase [Gemmatimonadota bacterium]|nr:MBL fold metallo-hydrolase [Gemmatimonadota bacterium]
MEPKIETRTLGRWKIHAIQAGGQKLDGGAMFGVVPKPLWERRIPADEKNRIQMGMRCLLVQHERGLVLIDNGLGNKETEKFHQIYGVENAGAEGRTWLEDALKKLGVDPRDVMMMIDTHLHFDHAGGNTYRDAEGQVRLAFPRARYVVQRAEYHWATNTNERTGASYFGHNFVPVMESGRLELVQGEVEILPGVTLMPTPGHTPGHQSVRLDSGGETALFLADLVPTAAHLPLPWIMGYDVEPLVTLETKRRILRAAHDQQWLIVFEHDATTPWGRVVHDGKGYALGAA